VRSRPHPASIKVYEFVSKYGLSKHRNCSSLLKTKMDKRKQANPDKGMKNSSPTTAQKAEAEARERAVTAYVNHELCTLVAAGLTDPIFDSTGSGGNRALPEAKFTRVTHSKRA
jgi:hypothetical protein